jgi:hypothetical protein
MLLSVSSKAVGSYKTHSYLDTETFHSVLGIVTYIDHLYVDYLNCQKVETRARHQGSGAGGSHL